MFKDAISFNIQKTKSNQTGFSFEFRTDSNNLWNNMKLNFLSTTRTDLEIGIIHDYLGATTFDLSSKLGTPGYVTYPLRQAWNNLDSLKIVTFLSAFTGLTSGSSIGFLITDQYIQKDILIFKYSAQQNTTISKITLNIVIFDMFNGAFRFEYGLFTETFLTSTKTTSLPPVIDWRGKDIDSRTQRFCCRNQHLIQFTDLSVGILKHYRFQVRACFRWLLFQLLVALLFIPFD